MEEYIKIVIMAVIQGITEFLPISSSGHLAVANMLFKIENVETTSMTVALHAGTLISICTVYRREIATLFTRSNRVLLRLIFWTLIPTGIIGMGFQLTHLNDRLAESPLALGICFWITALLLWFCLKPAPVLPDGGESGLDMKAISPWKAVVVGTAQGIAVLAGISRSGSTIAASAGVGMKRTQAAAFSFLIAIPAIAGAVCVKMLSAVREGMKSGDGVMSAFSIDEVCVLGVGLIISAFVGYLSLRGLIAMLRSGKLRYFAIYCFILGALMLAWAFCPCARSCGVKENAAQMADSAITLNAGAAQ